MIWLFLLGSLVAILIAAEVFTNALEHLGQRLKISEGVTGSLFAAVGTAMPETMVPGAGGGGRHRGHGGQSRHRRRRDRRRAADAVHAGVLPDGRRGARRPRASGAASRPSPAAPVATWTSSSWPSCSPASACCRRPTGQYGGLVRGGLAVALVLLYLYYVVLTLRSSAGLVEEGHGTTADDPMFLCRVGLPDVMPVVILQILLGFGLLVGGAKAFIYSVEQLSVLLAVSALILSLLIIPVATELPEKVNSILWIRRRKDTLAVGNLTGAMVFQGTLLPALGLLSTPWQPEPPVVVAITLTLAGHALAALASHPRRPAGPSSLDQRALLSALPRRHRPDHRREFPMTVVLITGASRGLGLELARQYAAGWRHGDRHLPGSGRSRRNSPHSRPAIPRRSGSRRSTSPTTRPSTRWPRSTGASPSTSSSTTRATSVPGIRIARGSTSSTSGPSTTPNGGGCWRSTPCRPRRWPRPSSSNVAASDRKLMVFVSSTTGSNVEGIYRHVRLLLEQGGPEQGRDHAGHRAEAAGHHLRRGVSRVTSGRSSAAMRRCWAWRRASPASGG